MQIIPNLDYLKSRLSRFRLRSAEITLPRDLHSPRYYRLREILVEGRKSAGLSQTALAAKLKRPQSYVADIERSERRIDLIEYLSISAAIELDPIKGIQELLRISDDS